MGGLVIDIIVAYFVRLIIRLKKLYGTRSWNRTEAKVVSSHLGGGYVWNCRTAEVAYIYRVRGEPYTGTDVYPFLSDASAEDRIQRFPRGSTVIVRVNPDNPEVSVLRTSDQPRSHAVSA